MGSVSSVVNLSHDVPGGTCGEWSACGGGKAWQLHTKAWTWECAHCGKQTSVTADTIMHRSKLPLTLWFFAGKAKAGATDCRGGGSNVSAAVQGRPSAPRSARHRAWSKCRNYRFAKISGANLAPIAKLGAGHGAGCGKEIETECYGRGDAGRARGAVCRRTQPWFCDRRDRRRPECGKRPARICADQPPQVHAPGSPLYPERNKLFRELALPNTISQDDGVEQATIWSFFRNWDRHKLDLDFEFLKLRLNATALRIGTPAQSDFAALVCYHGYAPWYEPDGSIAAGYRQELVELADLARADGLRVRLCLLWNIAREIAGDPEDFAPGHAPKRL